MKNGNGLILTLFLLALLFNIANNLGMGINISSSTTKYEKEMEIFEDGWRYGSYAAMTSMVLEKRFTTKMRREMFIEDSTNYSIMLK